MTRWIPVAIALAVSALALGLATACNEQAPPSPNVETDERETAAPVGPGASDPIPSSDEQAIRELMKWPSDAGEPRDVIIDYRDCLARMNAMPRLRQSSGLEQYAWMTGCMSDRGWQQDPDATSRTDRS